MSGYCLNLYMKYHSKKNRQLSEQSISDEFCIASNGPEINNCDSIVKNALDEHFGPKGWHFVSTTTQIFKESNVIGKLKNRDNNLGFM